MKRPMVLLCSVLLMSVLTGCATAYKSAPRESSSPVNMSESVDRSRMLIWRAWISLEVASVSNAVSSVSDIVRKSGGYIESKSASLETSASLTVRVPSRSLAPVMASLESIGKVTRRQVSSEDVTEQYVDVDARLKTKIALRDRLRALLDKAEGVKDILAIEKELSRVQGDIDSMQARLKALKGKVDLASISVSLKRRRILGPVGYIFAGAWWAVEKLFVIQN